MEVINDLLGYDGLKIIQDTDSFRFSLDSAFLADFVSVNDKITHILDMCSGNGPVPLLLSLKTSCKIIGVELQEHAYSLAKRSIELNKLENQIEMLNMDVNDLPNVYSNYTFNIITCNPPYFKYQENSHINKNDALTIARHEVKLNLAQMLDVAFKLLKDNGSFYFCHRVDRLEEIFVELNKKKFAIKKMRFIYPKRGKEAYLVLIEARKNAKPGSLKLLEPLIVYEENDYTEEVKKMFMTGRD